MRRIAVITGVIAACVLVVAAIAIPRLFNAAFGARDGDRMAEQQVVATADAIESGLGYQRDVFDAETLAASGFSSTRAEVTPAAWSGSTEDGDEAIIDVRIRAHVAAREHGFGDGPANSAGSAERCFRFTLVLSAYAQRSDLDCATLPTHVAPPEVTPQEALPADAEARLDRVLQESEPSDLAERVRAKFPSPGISVDTMVEHGEMIVALGLAESKECIVRVRGRDGAISRASFDRIQLEPGEGGCRVELYTDPAL